MADFVFNIARGRVNEMHRRVVNNDPANSGLVLVLLQAAEADDTLDNYDDLASLLAAAGNTEADFTSYTRKVLTDADLTAPAVDDANNNQAVDIPDQTWAAAGGTTDNTLAKLLICYDPDTTAGTDAEIVPLTAHDYVKTTTGTDLVINIDAAGYYRA